MSAVVATTFTGESRIMTRYETILNAMADFAAAVQLEDSMASAIPSRLEAHLASALGYASCANAGMFNRGKYTWTIGVNFKLSTGGQHHNVSYEVLIVPAEKFGDFIATVDGVPGNWSLQVARHTRQSPVRHEVEGIEMLAGALLDNLHERFLRGPIERLRNADDN